MGKVLMSQARVPYLLGHTEIASLFGVERQTSQKWRTEGTLPEPDLVASGNPYWLLATVLQISGGDRQADQQRLAAYRAGIPEGYDVQAKEDLPVVLGIQEVGRVLGRDAQAVSRWRNRRRIAEADLMLSGSPLWLLETVLADAQQRQRTVVPTEVEDLRTGRRVPQKPRGRRHGASAAPPPEEPLPAARTFSAADQTAAVEFLASMLAQGYSVVIKPQR
ncbi:hypothetical protein PV332_30110 [Streptomyces scabiei]|uniref:hypothetical protein n=1 Tax=Streptomyces TaxID=1883 RepID=UPI001F27603A|nr:MULTISPECIES: hypothetical protein [Streptomyces]MDW8475451.1 hypothetical protein [Streptomyces scabiei]MDX2568247.1 hypothetical protein [Streptomyces scabiei]MDX2579704.1 hypothetical protein [Streptomyces scabiei]MDX2626587.1 hypothetical protein [Streptomyces scabiei]MDX2654750.1 hypothetical protein [Streptomyces scabiei]